MPTRCCAAAAGAEAIYHLAAQTAVTTSVTDPRPISRSTRSARSTCWRRCARMRRNPIFIYSSTNKVYGGMEDARAVETETRYVLPDYPQGVSEDAAARFPFTLRLLEGRGRPVRARLRAHLRAAHGGLPAELYLRPAADGGGGSGLGRLVRHRRRDGQADHHLRQRQAGARPAARRRPGARLPDGDRAD